MGSLTRLYGSNVGGRVLTPRRVALAAAEACWEGLLGLEAAVKSVRLAFGIFAAQEKRFFRFSNRVYLCWQAWSVVAVVVVAGEVVVVASWRADPKVQVESAKNRLGVLGSFD